MRRAGRLPLEELAPSLLEVPGDPPPVLAWPAVFGNDHPVEIEVGFGKGLFLLTSSQQRPDVNFLGIEIIRKYQLFTATRIIKHKVPNVRLVCADARRWLTNHVVAGSVQAVHVYFPDPWWKTRHRKRRLFTEEFAAQCERILQPGGQLHLITDVADYFAVMTTTVAAATKLVLEPTDDRPAEALTNFERKYRAEGRPIYRALYQKPSVPL